MIMAAVCHITLFDTCTVPSIRSQTTERHSDFSTSRRQCLMCAVFSFQKVNNFSSLSDMKDRLLYMLCVYMCVPISTQYHPQGSFFPRFPFLLLLAFSSFPRSCSKLFIVRRKERLSKLVPYIKADPIVSTSLTPQCPPSQLCCSKTGRQGKPQKKSCFLYPPDTYQWGGGKNWWGVEKSGVKVWECVWESAKSTHLHLCMHVLKCVSFVFMCRTHTLVARGFRRPRGLMCWCDMALIVAAAANEITMRSERPTVGRPVRCHCLNPY